MYSRRITDLRELEEAQHAVTFTASADQKTRMHSEFTAICLTGETRLWSMEFFDEQAERVRCLDEIHVRFREKDNIFRQCSDNLREVEWNFAQYRPRHETCTTYRRMCDHWCTMHVARLFRAHRARPVDIDVRGHLAENVARLIALIFPPAHFVR